jgi:hypothetical protein
MRKCLFCQNPADSREHVWPDWVLGRLRGQRQPIKGFIEKKQIEFGGSNPHLEIKCVCSKCNNGWMSRLEDANVPLIGCLMQDIALSLDESQQRTVAAWAVKTVMVMDASRRHGQFYTRTECRQLRLSLSVPPHTMVWLGRYSGVNNLAIYGTDLWEGGTPDDPRAIHGYANTTFVGYLAIQVLTLRPPRQDGDRAVTIQPRKGPWDSLLVKVWPFEKIIRWPPRSSFTDRHPFPFPALVRRWSIGVSID